MWDILSATFNNSGSIVQRPSRGLVVLGIIAGFSAYFGSQYYTTNSIEIPEVQILKWDHASLGIGLWYVAKNYKEKNVSNSFPFLLSFNMEI